MVVNTFGQSCDIDFLGVKVKDECPVSCGVAQNMVRFIRNTDIVGYDPEALWVNIGKNLGIFRLYKDTDVLDGKEYLYALTAYDMGLRLKSGLSLCCCLMFVFYMSFCLFIKSGSNNFGIHTSLHICYFFRPFIYKQDY